MANVDDDPEDGRRRTRRRGTDVATTSISPVRAVARAGEGGGRKRKQKIYLL
jgi:hypothetical protein